VTRPPTKRGTAVWIAGVVFVSGVLALGGGIATFVTMSRAIVPDVIWDAGDGTPVPDDFAVVMYPADDDVAVYAEADDASERISTLGRAMTNRRWELADGWIGVTLPDRGGYVRQDRLVFEAGPARRETMVAAMMALHAAKGFDPSVSEVRPIETGGEHEYAARVQWSGGSWLESQWRVSDGGRGFEPLTMTSWHEQTVAAQGMVVVVVSGMVVVATFLGCVLVGVVGVLVVRYRRRAGADAARR